MSKEKNYEGSISSSYKNKELLKITISLGIIAAAITGVFLIGMFLVWWSIPIEWLYFVYLGFIIFFSIIAAIIIIAYVYNNAYVKNFTYTISEDHIILRHGVFTKIVATIPYSRIQNINIANGVFDRMFKTFTVKIETAGSSAAATNAQRGLMRPEGYIPGLKILSSSPLGTAENFVIISFIFFSIRKGSFKPGI